MSKYILREFISKTFNMKNEITHQYKTIVILHYENNNIIDYCTLQEEEINV
jgi:hypothetical protein